MRERIKRLFSVWPSAFIAISFVVSYFPSKVSFRIIYHQNFVSNTSCVFACCSLKVGGRMSFVQENKYDNTTRTRMEKSKLNSLSVLLPPKHAPTELALDAYLLVFLSGSFVDEEGSEEAEFYTSRYDSGTACDVRQLHRQTLVRYRCGESDVTLISDLKEPSTCSYVIDVETPLLCKHPKYRKKTKTTHAIRCLQVVEVDASISPTSYSHSIRHIPSPLRDTEFVFKEQHNIKTPTFTEVPGKSQGSPQQHHDLRQQQFKPNTPGQNLQQQQQQQKNPSASQPQEDGIKISKMKVVDENGHEIETAESGVKTHTSIDTDAARQRLSEHLSQFDQGTVTIEQLKQAIKKMPGFEELQDMEVEILDEAQLTEDMMERIAQGGINIVATEAEPEEDSEPFEIPDDDEEEQEKAN